MAPALMHRVLARLRRQSAPDGADELADAALLERFIARRDEAAFEALVRRHGPLVLGVCRRVLRNEADAEDAFQATFLVLVRRAGSLARRELLANWLYGVALRTAHAARAAAVKRRAKESAVMPREPIPVDESWRELMPALDEEIGRLPDRYRAPVVLCELQGTSRKDAARRLGLPEGTLSSRLARAKAILARRFARRGLALGSGGLAVFLGPETFAVPLPTALVTATVQAGALLHAGQPVAASAAVVLSERVVKTMLLAKLKAVAIVVLVSSAVAVGVGVVASQAPRPTAVASDEVASNAIQAGRFPKQARQTADTIPDALERFHVLVEIARAQFAGGDAPGARQTLHAAVELAGTLPDKRPKVMALMGAALEQDRVGDGPAARKTLHQAERSASAIANGNEKGNAIINLIRAQAFLGDLEGGLRSAADSGDFRSGALSFFAMGLQQAEAQHKDDRPAVRNALYQALEQVKADGSPIDRAQALGSIAAALAVYGDADGALRSVNSLDRTRRDQALRTIIVAQASAHDLVGAQRTVKDVRSELVRAEMLLTIARAQARVGDRTGAQTTLAEVRRLGEQLPEWPKSVRPSADKADFPSPKAMLAIGIAPVEFSLGDRDGALKTAATIRPDRSRASVLQEIGRELTIAGDLARARVVLSDAASAALQTRASSPELAITFDAQKSATLRVITLAQVKAGDLPGSIRTAEGIPTENERDIAFAEGIAPAQAEAGDDTAALHTFARIKTHDWQTLALRRIVQAQVKAGRTAAAQALIDRQTSPSLKAHALIGAALGNMKMPNADKRPE